MGRARKKQQLSKKEAAQIIAGLKKIGWYVDGDFLYAPHRTIWFYLKELWSGSLRNFRVRMLSRLYDRILPYAPARSPVAKDTRGLIEVLEELCADGGLQNYFRQIAPTLKAFAKRHNLRLGRFPQGLEAWDLLFHHPLGGTGRILIYRASKTHVQVSCIWFHNRGPINQRCISNIKRIALDSTSLTRALRAALRKILNWKSKDLMTQFVDLTSLFVDRFKDLARYQKRLPSPRL